MKKKLIIVISCLLMMAFGVGLTIAWLTDESNTVTNTFTTSQLFANPSEDFTLWEHLAVDRDEDGVEDGVYVLSNTETVPNSEGLTGNAYKILPGVDIPKDPTVSIEGLKENAYLYIEVTSTLPDTMTYAIDPDNWEKLTGLTENSNIYVYKGENATGNIIQAPLASMQVNILRGKTITVAANYVPEATTTEIKLAFKAYMVQAAGNGNSALDAWNNTYGNQSGSN